MADAAAGTEQLGFAREVNLNSRGGDAGDGLLDGLRKVVEIQHYLVNAVTLQQSQ